MKTKLKSSSERKLIVRVRDMKPGKDAKGGVVPDVKRKDEIDIHP